MRTGILILTLLQAPAGLTYIFLVSCPKIEPDVKRFILLILSMGVPISFSRLAFPLWEGRHKASLIEEETYLLVCYRYIELNPVRANMVTNPADYKWSSFRENTGVDKRCYVTEHECYRRLGLSKADRHLAYKQLFRLMLGDKVLDEVRRAATCSMPLGGSSFQTQIERAVGYELGYSKRGRPLKGPT